MQTENNIKTNTITDEKHVTQPLFSEASIKELLAKPEVQAALKKYVNVPDIVVIKNVKNPFKNKETGITTQKVGGLSGTSVADAVSVNFTLVDTELDPKESIHQQYRIVDCSLAMDANMSGGNFNGYSAKGFKLLVSKIEEWNGGKSNEKA